MLPAKKERVRSPPGPLSPVAPLEYISGPRPPGDRPAVAVPAATFAFSPRVLLALTSIVRRGSPRRRSAPPRGHSRIGPSTFSTLGRLERSLAAHLDAPAAPAL